METNQDVYDVYLQAGRWIRTACPSIRNAEMPVIVAGDIVAAGEEVGCTTVICASETRRTGNGGIYADLRTARDFERGKGAECCSHLCNPRCLFVV